MATFEIQLCGDQPQMLLVEGNELLLVTGSTWSFSSDTGQLICGTVVGPSVGVPNYTAATEFSGCGECITTITPNFTAGTIYEECYVCYNPSGYTATSVSVPHPVWTGIYGANVVQGSAVQLGGMNGLYS